MNRAQVRLIQDNTQAILDIAEDRLRDENCLGENARLDLKEIVGLAKAMLLTTGRAIASVRKRPGTEAVALRHCGNMNTGCCLDDLNDQECRCTCARCRQPTAPDAKCVTTGDGGCVAEDCMHSVPVSPAK